ncbi:GNAT family N-acetyltransferase [Actinoplanes regularis]|nr:GNAT family N-acetyltransferase [Actinoplanes regularis]
MAASPPPEVRELVRMEEFEQAVGVLCRVWGAESPVDLINASTLRAMSMARNYVAGVFVLGRMVGAAVAFRGPDHLHLHIAGVLPGHQDLGLGYLLMEHERKWASKAKFKSIQWTFDPLVRRNAHFYLTKFNTSVQGYERNLYGSLNDGLNDGDETDRLLISWDLASDSAPGGPEPVDAPFNPDFFWDYAQSTVALHALQDGAVLLVPTPADVEALRIKDPGLARVWREGVRAGFEKARDDGYEVTGFSPDGWYVLRPRRIPAPPEHSPRRG